MSAPFTPIHARVREVHRKINRDAADIANHDERLAGLLPGLEGSVFHEATELSNRGGLAISFMEGLEYADPETIQTLREIGREAVKASILRNQDLFIGLMLGEARQGRNYFTRFEDEGPELF